MDGTFYLWSPNKCGWTFIHAGTMFVQKIVLILICCHPASFSCSNSPGVCSKGRQLFFYAYFICSGIMHAGCLKGCVDLTTLLHITLTQWLMWVFILKHKVCLPLLIFIYLLPGFIIIIRLDVSSKTRIYRPPPHNPSPPPPLPHPGHTLSDYFLFFCDMLIMHAGIQKYVLVSCL